MFLEHIKNIESFYQFKNNEMTIMLISRPNKDKTKNKQKNPKVHKMPASGMNIDAKTLNKILANAIT